VQKGGLVFTGQTEALGLVTAGLQSAEEIIRLNRSEQEDRDVSIDNDDQISASCQPSDDRVV
jgi:hypothetical protein